MHASTVVNAFEVRREIARWLLRIDERPASAAASSPSALARADGDAKLRFMRLLFVVAATKIDY